MKQPVYIPIKPGGKVPLGKRQEGWQQVDETPVDWWEGVPEDVNKAMRLDGLVVLDADDASVVAQLEAELPQLQLAAQVRSPRENGGVHYYFRLPDGETHESAIALLPHLDVKSGSGHYTLQPGSRNIDGREYRLRNGITPEDAPVLPASVKEWLDEKFVARGGGSGSSNTGIVAGADFIPVGSRNHLLTSFAGLMRRQGFDDAGVSRVLNGLNTSLTESPLPDAEVAAIVRSSSRWEADNLEALIFEDDGEEAEEKGPLMWLHDMEMPPPAEWLWKPYLPKGRLVLMDGSEGIVKGFFTSMIAKKLMMGEFGDPGNVLWAATEDDPEDDIQRRVKAAGWEYDGEHGSIGFFTELPQFPKHIEALRLLIRRHDAKLVVLDPGRSFLRPPDGVAQSENDGLAVRYGLEPLSRLAKETGATILFIHHWNKNTNTSIQYRQGGSGAFAQVARHRVTLAWVGDDETGTGAFAVTKSNIGKKGHLHAYGLEDSAKEFDTGVWVDGGPITDYLDLGAWMEAKQKALTGGVVRQAPGDKLAAWATAALTPGAIFPTSAKTLTQLSKVQAKELNEAFDDLSDEGRVERRNDGANLVWIWKG